MAGSDTTATAIRTTMLYIMTTPRIYTKLLQEISDAIRLLEDMLNKDRSEVTKAGPNVLKEWVHLRLHRAALNPANHGSRVSLNNDLLIRSSCRTQIMSVQAAWSSACRIECSKRCDPPTASNLA